MSLLNDCSGSLVRPKVIKSVHYCPATKKTIERKYSDLTSLDPFPTSGVYPTKVWLYSEQKLEYPFVDIQTNLKGHLSFLNAVITVQTH